MELLGVWSLRRVLLAGNSCVMQRAMEDALCALGARVSHAANPLDEEMLSHLLHKGRCACVIVPDLLALHTSAQGRLSSLNMLLSESREAGLPLAMLLAGGKGGETAQLFSQAQGWACGASGDPVSLQCIRHWSDDPDYACLHALTLGARYLSGDHTCTGYFDLAKRTR